PPSTQSRHEAPDDLLRDGLGHHLPRSSRWLGDRGGALCSRPRGESSPSAHHHLQASRAPHGRGLRHLVLHLLHGRPVSLRGTVLRPGIRLGGLRPLSPCELDRDRRDLRRDDPDDRSGECPHAPENPPRIASTVSLAFASAPIFAAQLGEIIDAYQSRGFKVYYLNPFRRIRAFLALLPPTIFATLRRAQWTSVALEMKGFTYPGERTYRQASTLRPVDKALIAFQV